MKKVELVELYKLLQIPDSEVAKFNQIDSKLNMNEIKKLFHEAEEEFFEYLEEKLPNDYLAYLYIYLNLAIDLYEKYLKAGIDTKIYYDTIDDIRIWANNCVKENNTYGLSEIYWLNEHLRMKLFKLGRLQFQKRENEEFIPILKEHNLDKYVKSDYFYFVHIPEGEKLSREAVLDSYQKAIEFFNDEMIFAAETWIFSDKLHLVFNENSNIMQFRNDYIILNRYCEDNHIKRYLKEGSKALEKVIELENQGIMIGESFGICLNYIKK